MKKKPATALKTKSPLLYKRIRQILESAQSTIARSVNTTQVIAYWLIGREIVVEEQQGRKRALYGERLLTELSKNLTVEFGRGYSVHNLKFIRQFYLEYPVLTGEDEIGYALRSQFEPTGDIKNFAMRRGQPEKTDARRRKSNETATKSIIYVPRTESWEPGQLHPDLSWTHYRTLLRVEHKRARAFYEIEALQNNWSARELERQINSLLFERLLKSRDKAGLLKLATNGQEIQKPIDIFKDPVVIEFLGLPESHKIVESEIEQALINNLQAFLLELGKGFAFVARQHRITLDGDHFYIDLVFYHTILKCYVLIDLKIGKLAHGDLGQIQFYVNYFDQERRTKGDNPTLGLILCTDKNDAVVRYTLGSAQEKKIFASRYKLHLPTDEQLRKELRREIKLLSAGTGPSTGGKKNKTR